MNVLSGRNNLAVTIYVPYDCKNACNFCTSKSLYKKCSNDIDSMKETIKKYCSSKLIKDVVFTGGEPMENVEVLEELISLIPASKNIYINTSFIQKNAYEFITLVNSKNNIKGVNISRHDINIDEERKFLSNICEDNFIRFFEKPIKINVVLSHAIDSIVSEQGLESFILQCCERWKNFKNISISFREDYRVQKPEYLHLLKTETSSLFLNNMEFKNHSFCEVCDTMNFIYDGTLPVSYHRGLETTSINVTDDIVIINDIIIFPDGKVYYDWDKKSNDDVLNKIVSNKSKSSSGTKVKSSSSTVTSTSNICGYGTIC